MLHVALVLMGFVPSLQDSASPETVVPRIQVMPAVVIEGAGAPAYPRWSVGGGVEVWTGFGSIFNDVVGPYFNAGWRFDDRWSVGLTLFKTDFDFEDPADAVFGQSGTPVSDASIDMITVRATIRWHLVDPDGWLDLYVGGGLGMSFPGDGEAVTLPQVDITVEGNAGAEVHLAFGGAIRLFKPLYFTMELRVMQSFTEWDVTDELTGEQETEKGWAGIGFAAGLELRF